MQRVDPQAVGERARDDGRVAVEEPRREAQRVAERDEAEAAQRAGATGRAVGSGARRGVEREPRGEHERDRDEAARVAVGDKARRMTGAVDEDGVERVSVHHLRERGEPQHVEEHDALGARRRCVGRGHGPLPCLRACLCATGRVGDGGRPRGSVRGPRRAP